MELYNPADLNTSVLGQVIRTLENKKYRKVKSRVKIKNYHPRESNLCKKYPLVTREK